MKKAVKIIIKGTVQGVFFRNFIRDNANKLSLKGFVRNLESGNIEVFCEGEIDNVDKLCEVCKQGPRHSIIKNITVKEVPFQDFKDFKVLHI